MINVKELRIGNSIHDGDVSHIKPNLIVLYGKKSLRPEFATPIPITNEVFVKLGFNEIDDSGDFWNDDISIGISISDTGELSVYNNSDLEIHPKELKYLHQLQNIIFSISGKEITQQS